MFRFLLFVLLPSSVLAQSFENQLQTHLDLSRDEFIYIHTSQTFYEPGTDMYGTIWMFNANNKSFSGVSEFVELEILDPSGKLISSRKVAIYNGSGVFNFRFPQVSGLYTLRAKSVTNGLTFDKTHIIKQVQVQKIESSNLLLQIQADKPIYQKGDSVTMTIQCLSVLGQIPEGSELEYDVYLDGYAYQFGFLRTDNHGQAIFGCRLPKDRVFHSAMVQFKMNHQGLFGSQIKIIQLPGNGNQVEFYPESGLITEGLPAKVAFKLKDKYGVSKMGKGVLVNSKNEIITSVSTVHEGMGVFCFTPVAGLQYRLLIIDSEEQIDTFDLNGIRSKGCVMHVNQVSDSGIFIDVTGQLEKARLFARMGDNLVKRVDFNLDSFRRIFVPVSQLPMGIVQLSLFDSTWSLLGQRLVFVNYNKRLRVNYTFSQDNYDINEMVKLGIEVKDERGRPVTGMAAISVYQNDLYLASDPLAGNALSELYLTQELKNKVDRPAYYFKREFPLALAHLDLLMLCSESVRLPYRDLDSANKRLLILNNTKQQYVVRGRIFNRSEFEDADFYYPLIRVICLNNKQYFRVDSNGYFEIVGIPTDAELNFKVEAPGQHGHKFSVKPWKIVNDITKQAHVQWYIENDLDSFKILAKINQEFLNSSASDLKKDAIISPKRLERKHKLEASDKDNNSLVSGRKDGTVYYIDGIRYIELSCPAIFSGIAPKNAWLETSQSYTSMPAVEGTVFTATQVNLAKSTAHTVSVRAASRRLSGPNKTLVVSEIFVGDYGYYTWPSNRIGPLNYYDPFSFVQNPAGKEFRYDTFYNFNSIMSGNYGADYYNNQRKALCYFHHVVLDKNGKAFIEFKNTSKTGVFRCNALAAAAGKVIEQDTVYTVSNAILADFIVPNQIWKNEQISPLLKLKNTRNSPQPVQVSYSTANAHTDFKLLLEPLSAIDTLLPMIECSEPTFNYLLKLESVNASRLFNGHIKIKQPSKLNTFVHNGSNTRQSDTFYIDEHTDLSSNAKVSVNMQINLESFIEQVALSMLRMPHGCFEQVSSVNYPNILAYKYLSNKKGSNKPSDLDKYKSFILEGYRKMVSYETTKGGFEWYGGLPPHEGLTAYGLMQFIEMKALGISIDTMMFERVSNWLYKRFNTNGSMGQSIGKYSHFNKQDELVLTTYATWVLSHLKGFDLVKQVDYIEKSNKIKKDVYITAFLGEIYRLRGDLVKSTYCSEQLAELCRAKLDSLDCAFTLTRSQGRGKAIELYSVVAWNLLQAGQYDDIVRQLIGKIMQMRGTDGNFPSTQSSIWAMKSIVGWLEQSSFTREEVYLNILVNGEQHALSLENCVDKDLGIKLKHGMNIVSSNGLSSRGIFYQVICTWQNESKDIQSEQLGVKALVDKTTFGVGEVVPLKLRISNLTSNSLEQVVAVVDLPSGCNANPEQLRILKENGIVDYYEIIDNKVHLYFRHFDSLETKTIVIPYTPSIKGQLIQPEIIVYPYYYPEMVANTRMYSLKIE